MSFVHANVSALCQLVSGKILDAGIEVDFSVMLSPDWLPAPTPEPQPDDDGSEA